MILKSCIGNRSLGWDLLPPGSERYELVVKDKQGVEKTMVYAGYQLQARCVGERQGQRRGDRTGAVAGQGGQADRLVCGQAIRRRHFPKRKRCWKI